MESIIWDVLMHYQPLTFEKAEIAASTLREDGHFRVQRVCPWVTRHTSNHLAPLERQLLESPFCCSHEYSGLLPYQVVNHTQQKKMCMAPMIWSGCCLKK